MKILVLSDYYPPNTKGGADIAAFRLSSELASRGHSVRVLTTVQNRSETGTSTVRGVHVRKVLSRYPLRLRAYLAPYNPMVVGRVSAEIADFQPDIVHAQNIHTHISFQALIAARQAGVPVVMTAHDHQLFCASKFDCAGPESPVSISASRCAHCRRFRYNPLRNRLIRRAVRLSGVKILAVSAALRDDLIANGFDPNTIQVVHNGIDPETMLVGEDQVRSFARHHALDGKKVVLFGGRVSHAKGIDQAVAALGLLPSDLNFVFLVLGSSEDYVAYILQEGHRLSVEDRTVFLPWLSGDELKSAYAMSTVCLTPSIYREPFNLINIEAMALKKPVITTCFGGPPEVVVDGESGFVLDPRDVQLLATRLRELLTDEAKAAAMGEAGYRRVMEHFTIARQAEKTVSIYESMLSKPA
jgi:glycosyltransferase involved in cell wall biosynthesis